MLSSSVPRSPPPRPTHTPTSSQVSINSAYIDRSSQATVSPPSSPNLPASPGAKRPSLSTTMHWLSRSTNDKDKAASGSASPPTSYAPAKPVRISEPKYVRGIDSLAQPKPGVLGSGAIVVRTPDDALRDLHRTPSSKTKKRKPSISRSIIPPSSEALIEGSLSSPPLPPLPCPESDEEMVLSRSSSNSSKPRTPHIPAAAHLSVVVEQPSGPAQMSAQAPNPVPRSPSLRPSLKIRSVPSSDEKDVVPPLPSAVPPSPPPPFKPILVSEPPTFSTDLERVIVTLETCTATYRTTFDTLTSRPSHLSKYLKSLISPSQPKDSAASSLYSNAGNDSHDDLAIYRQHLASQGLLPQSSRNIHIFLDRASAPYAHILAYLRSPTGTPDYPECIPRAVLYQPPSQALRLEALIELRDEAAYLNLEGLHRLCVDEISRMRHSASSKSSTSSHSHSRGSSIGGASNSNVASGPFALGTSGSIQSLRASIHTLSTLLERVETDVRASVTSLPVPEAKQLAKADSKYTMDNAMSDPLPPMRTPPTPPSWDGPTHRRMGSLPVHRQAKPPPGWI